MQKKGRLWFDQSVTLNITGDIRNLIVFETQYLDNFLDELFYQILRKKIIRKLF